MDDLDLPADLLGWRFALGGLAIVLSVLALVRWPVPGVATLVRPLDRAAALATAFERWVIEAIAGAAAALLSAAAWVADVLDRDVLSVPGDAVARGVACVAGAVRPAVGGSLSRVTWALLALLATTGLLHAGWPGR
jgi:hypothetical protein